MNKSSFVCCKLQDEEADLGWLNGSQSTQASQTQQPGAAPAPAISEEEGDSNHEQRVGQQQQQQPENILSTPVALAHAPQSKVKGADAKQRAVRCSVLHTAWPGLVQAFEVKEQTKFQGKFNFKYTDCSQALQQMHKRRRLLAPVLDMLLPSLTPTCSYGSKVQKEGCSRQPRESKQGGQGCLVRTAGIDGQNVQGGQKADSASSCVY
jgi:hypothetical protein